MVKFSYFYNDLVICISPNLAFLCRNLDYKPYSINQSINGHMHSIAYPEHLQHPQLSSHTDLQAGPMCNLCQTIDVLVQLIASLNTDMSQSSYLGILVGLVTAICKKNLAQLCRSHTRTSFS